MKNLFYCLLFFILMLSSCGTPKTIFKTGDLWGGGVIFYIDDSGQHGLIATNYDVGINGDSEGSSYSWAPGNIAPDGSLGYYWSDNNDFVQTSSERGSGFLNTQAIINKQGIPTGTQKPYAAYVCSVLQHRTDTGALIDDWYLPSKSELLLLYKFYKNKTPAAGGPNRIGMYWSSTQGPMNRDSKYTSAEYLNFYDAIGGADSKRVRRLIRAVRSF